MNFFDLLEISQLRALDAALSPTVDSIYRMRLREYSDRFRTPLHECLELDPAFILQSLYEDKYRPAEIGEDLEEILQMLYKIKDPNYAPMSAAETEELVDAVINRELERAKKKKRPTQESIQADIKQAESKPKSGGMNFSDLERMEAQVEAPKAGFKKDQ